MRYLGADGVRRRKSGCESKSAAIKWFRDVVEPELRGEQAPQPDLTFAAFTELYLQHRSRSRPAGAPLA